MSLPAAPASRRKRVEKPGIAQLESSSGRQDLIAWSDASATSEVPTRYRSSSEGGRSAVRCPATCRSRTAPVHGRERAGSPARSPRRRASRARTGRARARPWRAPPRRYAKREPDSRAPRSMSIIAPASSRWSRAGGAAADRARSHGVLQRRLRRRQVRERCEQRVTLRPDRGFGVAQLPSARGQRRELLTLLRCRRAHPSAAGAVLLRPEFSSSAVIARQRASSSRKLSTRRRHARCGARAPRGPPLARIGSPDVEHARGQEGGGGGSVPSG